MQMDQIIQEEPLSSESWLQLWGTCWGFAARETTTHHYLSQEHTHGSVYYYYGHLEGTTVVSHSGKVEKVQDSDKSMGSSTKESTEKTTLYFGKLLQRESHMGHLLDLPTNTAINFSSWRNQVEWWLHVRTQEPDNMDSNPRFVPNSCESLNLCNIHHLTLF